VAAEGSEEADLVHVVPGVDALKPFQN
jgi:hypothetical protein